MALAHIGGQERPECVVGDQSVALAGADYIAGLADIQLPAYRQGITRSSQAPHVAGTSPMER